MTYKLDFADAAYKEWKKLAPDIRLQFKKKLEERLKHPRIPSAALSGMKDCYKIKLRDAGYRLVYRVEDDCLIVFVLAIGKRDKDEVYMDAKNRLH